MTKQNEELSLARALGFHGAYAIRKMRRYLERKPRQGPTKPKPVSHAGLRKRKVDAWLAEQERQVGLGLHNFKD